MPEGESGGELEEDIDHEEDKEGEGVAIADVEMQVFVHARYAHVG